MATEHMRVIGSEFGVAIPFPERRAKRLMGALRRRMREWLCGLSGHECYTHRDRNRVSLRCIICGHESPGWDVSGPRPVLRLAGDPRRHLLVVPRADTTLDGHRPGMRRTG